MHTLTITEYVIAEAAGHWNKARRVGFDIPGVTYLTIAFPVFIDDQLTHCRIDVYSPRPQRGSASVVIGGTGHPIIPTDEMIAAFTARDCVDIFA